MSDNKKSKLIILSAPSGAGKTTLCSRLSREFPENIVTSISTTTRAPRGSEIDGQHYFFVPEEQFVKDRDEGNFAEWAIVHDSFYGTSRKFLEDNLNSGKSVLLDIDVQGAEQLRKAFPGQHLSFFVSPPSLEVLRHRLRQRGTDAQEKIEVRIENAKREMARANEFDHQIVNDDLERAYDELRNLVLKELNWKGD